MVNIKMVFNVISVIFFKLESAIRITQRGCNRSYNSKDATLYATVRI